MSYKSIEENPVFKAGKEHGRFIAKQIMPHTVKKREFNLPENEVNSNANNELTKTKKEQ